MPDTILVPFDCGCGAQCEVAVVIDTPSVPCDGRCTPESGCNAECCYWHAVAPVTCEDCGYPHSVIQLNESDTLDVSVQGYEQLEREAA